MSKKIFIIIFILLLFTNNDVFAGDIPEGIMLGEQKALFIGKITAINNKTYSIMPSTIMMGKIQQSEIKIKKFGKYYGTNDKPIVGDFIIAILVNDSHVDESWIFKTTSDNYKTLKLISERYNIVIRYEDYINEGKYFEAQKKIDKNNNTNNTEDDVIVKNNTIQSSLYNKKNIPVLGIFVIVFLFVIKLKKYFH